MSQLTEDKAKVEVAAQGFVAKQLAWVKANKVALLLGLVVGVLLARVVL